MDQLVSRLRQFNRAMTRRIGALDDHFVGRPRPLGESRLLFEIGSDSSELRQLRRRLGLDSGYASRLLRSLARQGLIRIERAETDARVRVARTTAKGRREIAELDRASDASARTILAPLSLSQRDRLIAALAEAERLFDVSAVVISVEKPSSADAQRCIGRYFEELDRRFSHGFRHDRSIAEDIAGLTPPRGWILVARIYDDPVGCGTLTAGTSDFGEIKRVWVADHLRGQGVGGRLMTELENLARAAGLPLLRLDTNEALAEAQSMYRALGYREIGRYNENPYAHHWFEKRLR